MFMLLSPSAPATINVQRGAGHIAGRRRRQEQKRTCDLFRLSEPPQHGPRCQPGGQTLPRLGGKGARRQRIDTDTLGSQLGGEMTGELQQRGLGGTVMKGALTIPGVVK